MTHKEHDFCDTSELDSQNRTPTQASAAQSPYIVTPPKTPDPIELDKVVTYAQSNKAIPHPFIPKSGNPLVILLDPPCVKWASRNAEFTTPINQAEYNKWRLWQNCQDRLYVTEQQQSGAPIRVENDVNVEYWELAPGYPLPLVYNGVTWPTLEHVYYAQQYSIHPEVSNAIQKLPTTLELYSYLGTQAVKYHPRADWEEAKDDAMFQATLQRLKQHPVLRELLLCTGTQQIYYKNHIENYWGIGGNGLGRNKFGQLLMKIRSDWAQELRDAAAFKI